MQRIIRAPEFSVAAALVVVTIVFGLINPLLFSYGNVVSILRSTAYTGIIAIGMALCLISGTIDLSVGSTAGLAGVVMATLIIKNDLPWWVGVGGGIVVGVGMGLVNWIAIIKFSITPFIATIGTMYVARSLAMVVSNANSVYPLPSFMGEIGSKSLGGLSVVFLVFLALIILFELLLRFSLWGWLVRATGSDREVARCTEVNVDKISLQALIIVGVLASVAGMMLALKLSAGQPSVGQGWELTAITACAIGRVSLFGFEGSMIGVGLGVLLMQVMVNGMVIIGLSPYWQLALTGIVLILSMASDMARRNKSILFEKVREQ